MTRCLSTCAASFESTSSLWWAVDHIRLTLLFSIGSIPWRFAHGATHRSTQARPPVPDVMGNMGQGKKPSAGRVSQTHLVTIGQGSTRYSRSTLGWTLVSKGAVLHWGRHSCSRMLSHCGGQLCTRVLCTLVRPFVPQQALGICCEPRIAQICSHHPDV